MEFKIKKLTNLRYQLCFDLNDKWIEISEGNKNIFAEIRMNNDSTYELIIYNTTENISLAINDLNRLVEIAKKELNEDTFLDKGKIEFPLI